NQSVGVPSSSHTNPPVILTQSDLPSTLTDKIPQAQSRQTPRCTCKQSNGVRYTGVCRERVSNASTVLPRHTWTISQGKGQQ
ncbi:hypothetical protein BaRGS_00034681, partial [Batillaria attramentaria]